MRKPKTYTIVHADKGGKLQFIPVATEEQIEPALSKANLKKEDVGLFEGNRLTLKNPLVIDRGPAKPRKPREKKPATTPDRPRDVRPANGESKEGAVT